MEEFTPSFPNRQTVPLNRAIMASVLDGSVGVVLTEALTFQINNEPLNHILLDAAGFAIPAIASFVRNRRDNG